MHSTTPRPAPRFDVQVLRGVAVAVVIAGHASGVPAGGWLGVDVFFVLSGFVITRSLVAEQERTGRIDLVAFAVRRLRRLLPAALVVLAVTTVLSWVVWYRPRAMSVTGDAVASLLGSMNWHLAAADTDYFADEAASPLQHFWSLSVEEQFYAVWPLVLVVVSIPAVRRLRHGRRTIVGLLVVAALAFATVSGPLEGPTYFSTGTRAWELLLGAFCGLFPDPRWSRRTARVIRAAAAVLLVAGIATAPDADAPVVTVGFATAALLLAGDLGEHSVLRVPSRPLAALGGISYSAYLWHWPLIVTASAVLPGALGTSVAVVVALGLAVLSARWVERPFTATARTDALRQGQRQRHRHRRRTVGRRRVVVLLVPAAVLLASGSTVTGLDPSKATTLLGPRGTVPAGNAEPFRDHAAMLRAIASGTADGAADSATSGTAGGTPSAAASGAPSASPNRPPGSALPDAAGPGSLPAAMQPDGCLVPVGAPLRTCGLTTDVDVLLLGDSTTTAWSSTVIGALPADAEHAVVGVASCSAVLPEPEVRARWDAGCTAAKRAMHELVEDLDPRVVVISSVTGEYREHLGDLPEPEAETIWQRSVEATAEALRRDHREVVVLSAPQYGPDVRSCPDRVHGFAPCTTGQTPDAAAKTSAERRAAEHVGFSFVDGAAWLCDAERRVCPAVIDGTLVRVDQLHTTEAMGRRLVPLMRSAVDWERLIRE